MEDIYLLVTFIYKNTTWNGAIPIKAKYQGVEIPLAKDDIFAWAQECYDSLNPSNYTQWKDDQDEYWKNKDADSTLLVFSALNGEEKTTKWLCRKCGPLPRVNPQSASRIRSLKMLGYHIATLKGDCQTCSSKQNFDLLIRLPRFAADNQKRFTISRALRNRIIKLLENTECVFDTKIDPKACIIDHKFPSSRWVNGETVNHLDMPDDEIRAKFQILSNQTNLAKERYCQNCVINGIRGNLFGIRWYYEGDETWRGSSKADENGCIGCPWYDIKKWKLEFSNFLADKVKN